MGFMKEFKDFAMKGNVMDLAIGVIIGQAFGKIVDSLVKSVITPVIAMFTGGTDKFAHLTLGPILIGDLITAVLDFVIIAFVLFLIVKGINSVKQKTVAVPPGPSKTETLLEEIRDALKK